MSILVEVNFRWKYQVIFSYWAEIFILFNVGILGYEFCQILFGEDVLIFLIKYFY